MRLILILLFILPSFCIAEARIDEMCKPLSKNQGWHRGDTVYWEKKVLPAYANIVDSSKIEATRNLTYKTSLKMYQWSDAKINQANRLRIQEECDLTDLSSSNACHHMQAYCLHSISTDTLNKSFDSFNKCTQPGNNPSWCGESFQTEEGIRGNLNQLTYISNEIEKIQKGMDQNLNDYFGDVISSLEELKQKLARAKAQSAAKIKELDQKIKEKYDRLKKEDENFNNTCSILDKCDDYIKNEGYEDKHQLLNQVAFCSVEANNNLESDFAPLEGLLKGLQSHNEKVELKKLAISSLNNSRKQTIKEYASVYTALYGQAPDKAKICFDIPSMCNDEEAINYLQSMELANHLRMIPKMNIQKDISQYNQLADETNALCEKARGGHIDDKLEEEINQKLFEVMYQSRMGQLMSVKHFRDDIRPFNQEDCFEDGVGFKSISEDKAGEELVKQGIRGILNLQREKANQIKDQEKQIKYAARSQPINDDILLKELRNIIRNDPYMVREAVAASGSPDQALWICKATHDLYKREKRENIGKWIVTGLAIAGALVATVFTGGLAAPALVASIAMAGGLAGYNLYQAKTARHNAEKSIAIKSSEVIFKSMQLPQLDSDVKAAYAEVAMAALPGAVKALKYTGQGISLALNGSKIVGTGSNLFNATGKVGQAIQKGTAVTEKMLQKAIAAKLPGADPSKVKLWSQVIVGTSHDMILEITAFAAVHPDPFSEGGIRALATSLAMSGSMNALGPVGRQIVNKYNRNRTNKSLAALNNQTSGTTQETIVKNNIVDIIPTNINSPDLTGGANNTLTLQSKKSSSATSPSSTVSTTSQALGNGGVKNVSSSSINKTNSITQNKKSNIDSPSSTRTTASNKPKSFDLNSSFGTRKELLSNLKQNGGGELTLPNGKTYQAKYLGEGNATMMFDIGDDQVIRISKSTQTSGFGAKAFVDGYRQIKDGGVPVVKLIDADVSNGYTIVQKLNIDPEVKSFQDYIRNKDAGKYTPEQIKKIEEDFLAFSDKTYKYEYFGDFKSDQIIYTKDRGWVLADVVSGNKLYVDPNKNNTIFETGNQSSFTASSRELIDKANQRIKNLRVQNETPTLEIKSYMADQKTTISNAQTILNRPMTSKETNAVLKLKSKMSKGFVGQDGVNTTTSDNLTPNQRTEIETKLTDAGFNETEVKVLIDNDGVTYTYKQTTSELDPIATAFTESSRTHVMDGEFSQVNFKGEITYKLKGGMHTDNAVNNLISNNKAVRDIMVDSSGNIKPEFIIEHPNGIREILIPKDGWIGKKFKSVKNVSEQYGGITYKTIDGHEVLGKTMFPKSWDEEMILTKARQLMSENKGSYHEQIGTTEFKGTIDDIDFMLVLDENKQIRTFYPLIED